MRAYFTPRKNSTLLFSYFLISFAFTIVFTRFFLALTGYVKISNGVLHIAHLNWGGLLLIIAVLLLLLVRGRLVLVLGAILGGMGFGLFLDEIGKFITVDNDYFFRPAAVIIYLFFLLFFLLLLYFRRDRRIISSKTRLYYVMDYLEELIENDFDLEERLMVEDELELIISQNDDPDVTALAKTLQKHIREQEVPVREDDIFNHFYKINQRFKDKVDSLPNNHILRFFNVVLILRVIGSLGWIVIVALTYLDHDIALLDNLYSHLDIQHGTSTYLFIAMSFIRLIISAVMIYSLKTLNKGSRKAIYTITVSLWINILFIDLFDYYFNQFAAVIATFVDISLLAFMNDYSNKLAQKDSKIVKKSSR